MSCFVVFSLRIGSVHISSDAKRNVGLSLMVAGYSELTEVVVVFGSQVLRGTRVTKSNCAGIAAFSSPNFPAIGSIGVDVVIHDRLRAHRPSGKFQVFTDLECNVCTLKLTPGMPVEVLEAIFSTRKRPFAVVLELFGAGTAPNNDHFLSAIKMAIDSGIIVVATTQCEHGATNLLIYENGVWISSLGVICARDMTPEAITAKLYYLMGAHTTQESVCTRLLLGLANSLPYPEIPSRTLCGLVTCSFSSVHAWNKDYRCGG